VVGGFLALLSAFTFAFNNASVRRGVLSGSVFQAMAITVPIGVPIFLIAALMLGSLKGLPQFPTSSLAWLALAGVMHFVWGRYCNYRATQAMGAILVGPVQQASMIFTLTLAIWLLGETLTPLRAIGIVLVVLGPSILLPGESGKKNKKEVVAKVSTSPPARRRRSSPGTWRAIPSLCCLRPATG
jgi:drug/metabolite transporter (DMT)-like permease